ncbi:MAG TPA: class I SAM-dependent methyltransferase [Pseudonocardiaceae bacterium]|jgi:SAM-dependent methyltransferase|nr:class I SAM-dependent methyltransferase [Pseudonocardiaceae bacterium]
MTAVTGEHADQYVFDNDSPHAAEQHRCLAAMLDPITTSRLAETGVADGWHCLDVGAGSGGVARWLADRVAPTGSVLATDINPNHLPAAPGLTVAVHDVVRDPLPDKGFDLINARLVLRHLPERIAVLRRLVGALRPGGWLQLDEFDTGYEQGLMADDHARTQYAAFLGAKSAVMALAGVDGHWGRKAPAAMADAGLVDIDVDVRVQTLRSDSPGAALLLHNTFHLRDRFVAVGFADDRLREVRKIITDPSFLAASCPIYSVRGRRRS